MKLDYRTYYDKVLGCYYGKTIGGTLGAPFECYRGVYDVDFYVQDTSKPIPNDDVDLQLVWLRAVELEGRKIDAHILGEYWLTYISASLCEYGSGKNNMKMGIHPPLSGHMNNLNRNSNGAWIRSEIWASLCPANPYLAAKYAYEDSCVDHSGEGIYAAVFCAAVQSAAFVEANTDKLIEIGLSYIPEDCGVARAIRCVIESYRAGDDFRTARKKLFRAEAGSFGMIGGYWTGTDYEKTLPPSDKYPAQEPESDVPVGPQGYDAPSNIGIVIIGWLYGEGDFGKSICIATNCGEDTDCTAGTLGALLGIISGRSGLPAKWVDNCSDQIATWCLRIDAGLRLPKTISQLTDRIVRQTPVMLGSEICDVTAQGGYTVTAQENLVNPFADADDLGLRLTAKTNTTHNEFTLYAVDITYDDDLTSVTEGKEKRLHITITNRLFDPQYLTLRLIGLPEGWSVAGGAEKCVGVENIHGGRHISSIDFDITPAQLSKGQYTVVLEISTLGRLTRNYIPLSFVNGFCM